MIEAYLADLQRALSESPIVAAPELQVEDRAGQAWLVRGNIYFIDNSLLHFRELWILRDAFHRQVYTYHYQSADGELLFRYDNAAHYPDLPTYPHHKHIGPALVVAAPPPEWMDVLKEIEAMF